MTQKITTFPTAATPGKFSEKVVDAPHLEPYEVLIKMLACGICHTDCAFLGAGEGLILGHEPVGRVVALGSEVSRLKVGDIVGTSYLLKTCLDCIECNSGNDNMCEKRVMFPGEGNLKYNGFADHKIADSRFAAKIPENLEPKYAAPLMCAGITVFNAIYISNVRPTGRIGVVGIGGLGHLALQFARAWGCHVTAISGSADKKEEALSFGAHDFLVSRNLKIEDVKAEDKFDLILDTVSASLDWDLYISLLKRNGAMYLMGFPDKPMEIQNAANLITAQASLRGAINGGRYLTELMLDFADRHNIKPMVEEYPFSVQGIEESMEVCGKSKARYRGVLVAKE